MLKRFLGKKRLFTLGSTQTVMHIIMYFYGGVSELHPVSPTHIVMQGCRIVTLIGEDSICMGKGFEGAVTIAW